jgi:hypothetical protein
MVISPRKGNMMIVNKVLKCRCTWKLFDFIYTVSSPNRHTKKMNYAQAFVRVYVRERRCAVILQCWHHTEAARSGEKVTVLLSWSAWP